MPPLPLSPFLSDAQWSLLQPLFPASSRGRPPLDNRLILELIFHRLTTRTPWYDLPTPPPGPSWQTCYQRYHRWQHTRVWDSLVHTLYADLLARGGLDLIDSIQRKEISTHLGSSGALEVTLPEHLVGTWQQSTATLLIHLLLAQLKPSRQALPTPPGPT